MTNINYENRRLLDVVNEEDKIVGLKSRADVHSLGLLHREIHVWFLDKDRNIFFQKRGLHRPSAGLLDATIGGHVNKGEEYLSAAKRECKEEAGVSVRADDLIFLKKFKGTSNLSKDNIVGTVNNFIRSIYVLRLPIKDSQLKKEKGIPGGGFVKFSPDILEKHSKKNVKLFNQFILKDELPNVVNYINSLK